MNETIVRLGIVILFVLLAYGAWNLVLFLIARKGQASADPNGYHAGSPAILYFYSDNCVPCKTVQRKAIDELEQSEQNVQVIRIDAVNDSLTASRWSVFSVPTTIVLSADGKALAINPGIASASTLRAQLAKAG